VELAAHDGITLSAFEVFGAFFDLTNAYRFGPAAHEVTVARLEDDTGAAVAEGFHLLSGTMTRRRETGLTARLERGGTGWRLMLACERAAYGVHIEDPVFRPAENYFHLMPGAEKAVALIGPGECVPVGRVSALSDGRAVDYAASEASAQAKGAGA